MSAMVETGACVTENATDLARIRAPGPRRTETTPEQNTTKHRLQTDRPKQGPSLNGPPPTLKETGPDLEL